MENNVEIREVDGFDGYFAGSDGNIYSNKRINVARKSPTGVYRVAPKVHNKGYLEFGFALGNKKRKWKMVHQIILETFTGPKPSEKHECHHINNNKKDNRPENLQWVTRSENIYHTYHTHLRETKIRPIYYNGKKYISIRACSVELGLNQASLNATLSRMTSLGLKETKYKGKPLSYATKTKVWGKCVLSDWETSPKE